MVAFTRYLFIMYIVWLRVLLVIVMALLLLGSFLSGSIEPFTEPETCRFVAKKMRYTTNSMGDDIQSLFRSNNGTRRSRSMNRKQCQAKCSSMQGCRGYIIPRDGECVLYEEGKLLENPPDTISEPVPFYECRDSAPPKYLEQRDSRIDITCRPTTSTKPCKTCSYLGSPGCSEGSCLTPFTSDSDIKLSSCTQWKGLLDRFPDAVDTTKGGLVDKNTFLEATCGKNTIQSPIGENSIKNAGQAATKLTTGDTSDVMFLTTSSWYNGFVGNFKLTNSTKQAFNDWKLEFLLDDAITIDKEWNGKFNRDGTTITVIPEDWNATIEPGSSITVGFEASHVPGTYQMPQPINFSKGL